MVLVLSDISGLPAQRWLVKALHTFASLSLLCYTEGSVPFAGEYLLRLAALQAVSVTEDDKYRQKIHRFLISTIIPLQPTVMRAAF